MRDNLGSLKKLTESVDGRLRFISKPPLVVPSRELSLDPEATADLASWVTNVLHQYSESLQSDRRHFIHSASLLIWRARSSASAASARGRGSYC